uniref:Decapping nuclease n=1 Tax=Blastobotrys adeninivorans TaxID=409370 RepID=A0A060TD59_BLAAD
MSASTLPLNKRIKASLRQPKEICSFSIDENYETQLDNRCLSYFYLPEAFLDYNIDLSAGFSDFTEKDESIDVHLNHMLKALLHYEQENDTKVKVDMITFRGIMTKILCLSYSKNEDLDLNIVRFDNQLFMEEDHDLLMSRKRPMGPRDKMMSYWGYKFEAVSTLRKPWSETTRDEIENRSKVPVNNIEQYLSIVRTGIGSVRLLLGAEVDCVKDYKPEAPKDPLPHYMELKTSSVIYDEKEARKFERKLFKTWAQSFLLGVRHIVYGFRDQNGKLESIEHFKTEQLPILVRDSSYTHKNAKWNGNDSIAFYGAVIEWIKETIGTTGDDFGTAWRLQFRAGDQQIHLYPLEGPENEKVLRSLLLPEFVEWRKQRRAQEQENKPADA